MMKQRWPLVLVLFGALAWGAPARGEFVHPGISQSEKNLDFVKGKIAAGARRDLSPRD